ERGEAGGHVVVAGWVVVPKVGHRQRDVLSESAGTVDADAFGVFAQMSPARQAVPAPAADDVPFAADHLAGVEINHVGADGDDLADELMADDHRYGERLACPLIPLPNVDVGAADA